MRKISEILLVQDNIKLGPETIGKYCAEAVQEWEANKNDTIASHKARELEKINRLEDMYVLGWHRSLEAELIEMKEKTKGKDGGKMTISKQRENRKQPVGDPRFLDGVSACVKMRCVILGIDAPAQRKDGEIPALPGTVVHLRKVQFSVRKLQAETKAIVNGE